ncbi:MAG: DUF1824 family protein [Prochlorococcaceae cyanobacterium]|jgi:hypothetical protein
MSMSLADLRGLRSAPQLDQSQRDSLKAELEPRLAACDWFTIGVMASNGAEAIKALRALEAAQGWPALEADPASPSDSDVHEAAFLKGNQNTGRYQLRPESGLGQGLLITGHSPSDPGAEDTWGPLPLDLFG